MHKLKNNQSGFGVLEIVLIIFLVTLIVATGLYVWKIRSQNNSSISSVDKTKMIIPGEGCKAGPIPGELGVEFNSATSSVRVNEIFSKVGITEKQITRFPYSPESFSIKVSKGTEKAVITKLSSYAEVKGAFQDSSACPG